MNDFIISIHFTMTNFGDLEKCHIGTVYNVNLFDIDKVVTFEKCHIGSVYLLAKNVTLFQLITVITTEFKEIKNIYGRFC